MLLNKKNYKKIIYPLIFLTLIFTSTFLIKPKKVSAVAGFFDTVEEVGPNLFTNLLNTESVTALQVKEFILDTVAFTVVNGLIEHIADSTVDWINNGFEGGPGFITNFDDYLTDVGDQVLGDFISGSPLAFLCSPFSLDIKIALALQFGSEREARCTLSDAFDNIDSAVDDLGNNWSWNQFSVLSQSRNNTYGAYAAAYTDVKLNMAGAEDKQIIKGNWGGGMLSFESCEDDYDETDCETSQIEGECETYSVPGDCTTNTPGSLIQDTLADTLTLGNKRLVISDEIDEIVGALLNQLFKSVLGEKGLLNGNPGGDDNENFSKIPASTVKALKDNINDAITLEEEYSYWKEQSLAIVNLAKEYLLAVIDCWNEYTGDGAIPPLTQIEVDAKIEAARTIIRETIEPLRTSLAADTANITALRAFLTEIDNATDDNGEADPTVINDILGRFRDMDLHTPTDAVKAELEYQEVIKPAMDKIITDVGADSTTCTEGGGIFKSSLISCTIELTPENIALRGSSTLRFTSINVTSGSIDNGIEVPSNELEDWSTTVSPSTTTTYTGTVIGDGGTATCPPATLTVD